MADYDLVVIGGTPAGATAAIAAARYHARVALVEQGTPLGQGFSLAGQALEYATQSLEVATQLGLLPSALERGRRQLRDPLVAWTREAQHRDHAAAALAGLGVDVLSGYGEFRRQPQLRFDLPERVLRSRAYLLAPNPEPILPQIPGLVDSGYLTPQTVYQRLGPFSVPQTWPQTVIIVGGDPLGVALAQTLVRLGVQVTIVVGSCHILAKEDPDAAALIQAQLEADGVRILTQSRVTQVRQIQSRKWVQAGDFALEADEIILAAGLQLSMAGFNLAAVGVACSAHGPELNARLQTTHAQIYACRSAIAGYFTPHIARYEAELAVKNALFLPLRSAHYPGMPWATFTDPELVRIGLTEPQAQQRYGKHLTVLRQPYKTNEKAQSRGATTGFCKLLVGPRQCLVGAHLVGPGASELISPLVLAVRQRLPVRAIANLPFLSPTCSELLQTTAQGWLADHQAVRRNWLEGYLNVSRSWFS